MSRDKNSNTGNANTGYYNTGNYNTGDSNTGHRNTGYYNTGNSNTGNANTGNYNTGNSNTGNYNTGNSNTANFNTGHRNTGNYNTGDFNTGYYNTGNVNTGYYNTGNSNTGNYNTGNSNTGFFNTNEPTIRLFNKETNLKRKDINLPYVNLKITEWISKGKMTDKQKEENPQYKTTKGFLLTRSYKEAWKIAWEEMKKGDKNKFLNLPNFCPKIFEEITGIDVLKDQKHTMIIDGKEIELSHESYLELKRAFSSDS
jgi:hypothetical protein